MTVRNCDALIDRLVSWIKDESSKRRANSLFVGAENNINCALAAVLCKRTGIKLYAVRKLSDDGVDRKDIVFNQFAKEKNIRSINPKISFTYSGDISYIYDAYWQSFAEEKNALIVGSFDREEYNIDKPYRKGVYDLMLLADLYKSEVLELYHKLTSCKRELIIKRPTIKEWIDRENVNNNILSAKDPSKEIAWGRYTGEQRVEVAKAHGMVSSNYWKVNPNLPVCKIRNIPGLVI